MKEYVLHELSSDPKTIIDYRSSLNAEQYEVVTKAEGPCLVLAGAGSGKTRTLIYRLSYLLERGEKPQNILLMTFTNKAAREMQDRAEMLLKYKPKGLWSGTFHHIGNRILRLYAADVGFKRDFSILDEHDSCDLLKVSMKGYRERMKEERFPKPTVIQAAISFSVNTGIKLEDCVAGKYPYLSRFAGEICRIKELYDEKKKRSNSMDFDDLLLVWKQLLESSPAARERFTKQFRYIMVDEYQDTNRLQSDIIDILASFHRNIIVVGDDAQAIYSFRGACVDNILTFPERFEGTKIFKLETNYRSTPDILGLANDSLSHNRRQFTKILKAVNGRTERPAIVEVKDLYAQSSFVAQRILEMRDEENIDLERIAVFFRAHYQSAELEMELVKRNIPYVVRGGLRFFEQAHIKDVLSYLKIIVNPLDEISWMRSLTLSPGIGSGYAASLFERFRDGGADMRRFLGGGVSGVLPPRAGSGFRRFKKIMDEVLVLSDNAPPSEMISAVMEAGYETHIMMNFENAKDRIDDIRELVNFSSGYSSLKSFLSDITLRENFRGETVLGRAEKDEHLVLTTIHQAKGLEWDACFVIGLCEGQFPHPKALQLDADMEEERRLFYVAVTRAKKYLYLVHPATRFDYQRGIVLARRSRFLEELSADTYEVWNAGAVADSVEEFEL